MGFFEQNAQVLVVFGDKWQKNLQIGSVSRIN